MNSALCRAAAAFSLCWAFLLSGCASSPSSRFYSLSPSSACVEKTALQSAPSVAVVWVTIPELVNRPQLVVKLDEFRVDILETHRWAEPLKEVLPRVIAEDVSCILGLEGVASYPQPSADSANFRIFVDIQRFDLQKERVTLDAFWIIRDASNSLVDNGRSRLNELSKGRGYEGAAEASSRALYLVGQDISDSLKKVLNK